MNQVIIRLETRLDWSLERKFKWNWNKFKEGLMKECLACRQGPPEKIKGNESKLGSRDKFGKELTRDSSPVNKDLLKK